MKRFIWSLPLAVGLLTIDGCVQRTLFINSDPPGAVVTMNGIELGRTPLQRDFVYYGTFDVQVRKEGYDTCDTRTRVIAPWWQWPPFDLAAEFYPFHAKDKRYLSYKLTESSTQPADPDTIMAKALIERENLESSRYTRAPNPTTFPATTRSATTQSSTTQSSTTQSSTTQSTTEPAITHSTALPTTDPTTAPPTVQPSL